MSRVGHKCTTSSSVELGSHVKYVKYRIQTPIFGGSPGRTRTCTGQPRGKVVRNSLQTLIPCFLSAPLVILVFGGNNTTAHSSGHRRAGGGGEEQDRKSTRLNSSHLGI